MSVIQCTRTRQVRSVIVWLYIKLDWSNVVILTCRSCSTLYNPRQRTQLMQSRRTSPVCAFLLLKRNECISYMSLCCDSIALHLDAFAHYQLYLVLTEGLSLLNTFVIIININLSIGLLTGLSRLSHPLYF